MSSARQGLVALAISALLGAVGVHAADELPAGKVVKVIVPFSPGGTSDILARKLANDLAARIGRTVIVENRAGAGGSIGTEAAVRGDPDGTTILIHSGAISVDPALKSDLPYDVERDLTPVTTAVAGPFAVLVNNTLPVKTMGELITYAKAHPGKLNYGSPGVGSSIHLTTEHLKAATGMDIMHVPFKGASLALNAAMANDVQVIIDPLATAKKYAEAGKLRALALTTASRSNMWPEMSTVDEAGIKGFDAAVWYGVFVPAKTPRAVVDRLNREFVGILKSPEMVAWLHAQGLEPVADTPQASQERMAREIQNWKKVIQANNIKRE
ncbi:tripartite tricarboxylate transporter substrate binding protein [Bordetella petrii]|nr:tripartite tricarboxylate transporter substrate binding protein [Bordetella petrii]